MGISLIFYCRLHAHHVESSLHRSVAHLIPKGLADSFCIILDFSHIEPMFMSTVIPRAWALLGDTEEAR